MVPLDAWEQTLRQLGHLYEAGQQLADARARAAKAETEAHFLRERVRELRAELRSPRVAGPEPSDQTPAAHVSESPAEGVPAPAASRWRWIRRRAAASAARPGR
ncbi:MAG: hypothetical protein ACE5EV_03415 [Gaiellales bacterium]